MIPACTGRIYKSRNLVLKIKFFASKLMLLGVGEATISSNYAIPHNFPIRVVASNFPIPCDGKKVKI